MPPFGGAFVANGTLKIWLLRTPAYPVDQAAEQARQALAEVAGMDYDRDQVEILDADYSWTNLVWWYERLPFALTAVPAVVDHEISIETNRIRVVVDDVDANRHGVVAELERSDIAVGAVEMVEAPAVDGFIDSNGVAVGVLAGLLIVFADSAREHVRRPPPRPHSQGGRRRLKVIHIFVATALRGTSARASWKWCRKQRCGGRSVQWAPAEPSSGGEVPIWRL